MKEKHPVIVIGRQFGSGGRALGKHLAKLLAIPYYDKEILAEAAQRLGFDRAIFDRADEKRPSFLRSAFHVNYDQQSTVWSLPTLSGEKLYEAQSKVVRQIAQEGGCVIVGRTADYVNRDHPGLLSVFIHADPRHRAGKIVSRGEAASIEEASERIRKEDRKREEYYNYFTGRHWGHADNYHLSMDSSKLSVEDMAEMILTYLHIRDRQDPHHS